MLDFYLLMLDSTQQNLLITLWEKYSEYFFNKIGY